MRIRCYRCGDSISHSRDATTITTANGDVTMPCRVRLCDGCATRLARWLRRRSSRPAPPPAEAPAIPRQGLRPVRLAVASDAFLEPPTGPSGWQPTAGTCDSG
jgi:hypothetical protein